MSVARPVPSVAVAMALLAGLAGLTACSPPDQPGQLTAEQDQALNRAAEMLDANSVALEDVGGDNAAPDVADAPQENVQ